ncbi:unnamed protein product [Cyclocybe aegerita]|uniref:Protein kinase domain-containing protein n=1 Tax=Cyclocybe aegerita TaxID=1973307 RepID=A0A8S0WCU1_CYCAE|nr:unnamed protein product [Cyclocybe aegerita]
MSTQSPTLLQCPPMPGAGSFRSRSSGSSTSSLSSTFSDITSSTSASSSSPPTSKTNAFFATPFSTRPPSPVTTPLAPTSQKAQPPRSLTADFFSTPLPSPSPPSPSMPPVKQNTFNLSRIFPSRYTSTAHRSPDQLQFMNLDANNIERRTHERNSSSGSESSFTSFVENRLPTPPPPSAVTPRPPHRQNTIVPRLQKEENLDQSTPKPPDHEPALLHFERSLLLAPQTQQRAKPEPEAFPMEDDRDDEEPQPGSLIPLPTSDPPSLPVSPLSMTFTVTAPTSSSPDDRSTPTPTNDASISGLFSERESSASAASSSTSEPTDLETHPNPTPVPTLRLQRCLGHGAFSSVWLAEDLSPVPLTLVSKRSVRDLRRRASGRDRERDSEALRERVIPVSETPAATQPSSAETKPDKRPPSRLREGLRSILALSPVSIPLLSTSPSNNDSHLSRNSSIKSSPSADIVALSRNSSIRSLPSIAGDLSRNSSLRSNPPSRNSSVRLPLSQDTTLSRDSSMKKFRERVRGTRPAFRLGRAYLDERDGEMGEPRDSEESRKGSEDGLSVPDVGLTASLSRQSSLNRKGYGRLVAVKMTPRKVKGARAREKEEEERTRVGFVREVEVLKHISHPNITPLLAHLSTSGHHILVLPYLPGGDLLGLVNGDVAWGKLGESVLRRIWCELCKAVGWMHGVGLVHRDVKLENILLTTPAFTSLAETSPRPTLACLPPPPAPLIKLTDFGLSRFVEIDANGDAELLSTRCGSEAYAAPELVTGGRAGYDARKTDAWACGVVLYALVERRLPFGEGVSADGEVKAKIGGERGVGYHGGHTSLTERRHWLMRIARGEWTWPNDDADIVDETPPANEANRHMEEDEEELVGPRLAKSQGARRIVNRLLVRDTRKRARIGDLWDDPWMNGAEEEQCKANEMLHEYEHYGLRGSDGTDDVSHRDSQEWSFDDEDEFGGDVRFYGGCTAVPLDDEDHDEEEEEEEGGCLLDHEGIDSITRQEVI